MCEQKQFEQTIRLTIVQELMQSHQIVETDLIIEQARALSDFVLEGADKATQCPKNPPYALLLLNIGDTK